MSSLLLSDRYLSGGASYASVTNRRAVPLRRQTAGRAQLALPRPLDSPNTHRLGPSRVLPGSTPFQCRSKPMTDHNHSDEISTLNTLIATTIDSITGY